MSVGAVFPKPLTNEPELGIQSMQCLSLIHIFKTDLPFGSYYVKELATDEHYILTDAKYPFTFSYAGQDTANVEIAVNDGKAIENKLIYGSVSGKKITENGEALGGAVIGLFKADETEFTKENALMTATRCV